MINKTFVALVGFLFSCGSFAPINTPMVMVSYSPWLAQQFSTDSRLLGIHTGKQGQRYLLLKDLSLAENEWLAAHTHASNHACGGIIYRATALTGDESARLYEPVLAPYTAYSQVRTLMDAPDKNTMLAHVKDLVSLGNRFHSNDSGLKATETVSAKFKASGDKYYDSIEQIDHSEYYSDVAQKSLVVRVLGSKRPDEIVIIGAHMDTIFGSRFEADQSQSPGADDDASGIATMLAIYRAFAENQASFDRTLEFHAYAAEEIGLIGSGDLADSYQRAGKKVVAMIQFDMTAYSTDPSSQTIYLPTNDTHSNLRRFAKEILKTYLGGDYGGGFITGGTSDHASWAYADYPTLFPFEHPRDYNKKLHTREDDLTQLNNPDLMLRFARFGIAAVSHLAGLESAVSEFDPEADVTPDIAEDLYVAIFSEDAGHRLAVSAPVSAKSLEFCETFKTRSQGCKSILTSLEGVVEKNGRQFFSSSVADLSADKHYRLTAFDSEDKLIAARDIVLQK